jgi:thiol:disulfide interchange protein DsbC
MKKVVAQRIDIAFYIKFFPLRGHKDAYWKSRSVLCTKSLRFLEDNFEHKPIPKVECATKEIDENLRFGEKNGITGTPTMVLPDGSVYSGYTDADKLIKMIDEASANIAKKTGNHGKSK